ncbi:hypothetical protein HIO71_13845 [Chryseobacterium aquaticum]|uniref:Uncharacterized protein n=3 Tax=Chryseobacterium TaxID=59732 RepID=A0A1N7I846_9FLAO|nr:MULTISPECIES: hypothetical protein [Chryseobacterium]EFK35952.1 hypothetical protein HMPREF0204_15021 [Chryseobacterium gleum ATCC 35910]NMR35266.1 hypothetical protein [Chryseobacterium aquaticum]NRQ47297.1 hypothetical protein [Chryseobacterium sp. C-204]UMQ41510.1 hypothetical protein MKS83_19260 [Chryseobacterium sp. Y16C]SIS33244.1 hypothetical protein SAMN05421639_102562 [Chryseobacterium shigense]
MIPHTYISIATGLPCPASGIWESMGNFKTTIALFKGELMPDYCGHKVRWKLLTEQ